MKTLMVGIVLGIAAKCLWDSQYGDELRESAHQWWTGVLDIVDDKIATAKSGNQNIS